MLWDSDFLDIFDMLKHPVVVDGQQKSESDQLMDYG